MNGLDLLHARAALIAMARPSVAYCKALNLDWAEVEAACGGVFVAPIRADGPWFDIGEDGDEALVLEVFGEDACSTTDLVAWLPDQPGRWWRAIGAAPSLGAAHAINPATYFGRTPLQLYQSPAEWLQADCHGAVLLDLADGVTWLYGLPQPLTIAVRDDEHAREIDATRRRLGFGRRHALVVPAGARVAA